MIKIKNVIILKSNNFFSDLSSYPLVFDNGDPLKDLMDQLLQCGVADMRHTFTKILDEAAVRLDDAIKQGDTPMGLRVVIDTVGRYVVLEHDAGHDDLGEVMERLGIEVLKLIYLFW